ncbi:MAG TPA: lytic transglycosylase domain-containing protein [Clostridia bacterium]
MKQSKLKNIWIYVTEHRYALLFIATALSIIIILDNSGKVMYPLRYRENVAKYSARYNIDPYLVFAIIKAESNFNPKAVSRKSAKGLMQITDKTGAWGAEKTKIEKFDTDDLYDPEININIGCWYLSNLMKEFNGNIDLVIAAYNGGSGNVNEWIRNSVNNGDGNMLPKIPFKETREFQKKVKKFYYIYRQLYENEI